MVFGNEKSLEAVICNAYTSGSKTIAASPPANREYIAK